MAFQQGLTGLNSASRNLDVIGNNIANANTVGMKTARAEFASLFASSVNGSSGVNAGIGVTVATVSQSFTQGNITLTGNDLDVAINGNGFFELTLPNGSFAYARDGQFKLDSSGNIVTNQGAQLMGYPTDANGVRQGFETVPLKLPTGAPIPGRPTANISAAFNLDARVQPAASTTPPTPLSTYGTSVIAYDAQGMEVPVGLAFEKVATNRWNVYTSVNGSDPAASTPFELQFNADGTVVLPAVPPTVTLQSTNGSGAPFEATLDLSRATQFGTGFAVSNLSQDGYGPGELTSLKIEENGIITARYTNGQTQAAGQLALVNFRNAQGLVPTGGGQWAASYTSGEPQRGEPGSGRFGSLRSGALEDSNVDLTAELVNMMTAQRAYQANAQTLKTQDQALSSLLNLR